MQEKRLNFFDLFVWFGELGALRNEALWDENTTEMHRCCYCSAWIWIILICGGVTDYTRMPSAAFWQFTL